MARHHRLGPGACAALRPGFEDARSRRQPAHDAKRPHHEGDRRRYGRWAHLPAHSGRRLFRRRPRGHERRSILRRCWAGSHRLHALRRLHDRMPHRGEEHPPEELSRARRGCGRRRPSPHHRRLNRGEARWRLCHHDRAHRGLGPSPSPHVHGRPCRHGRGHVQHPAAPASDEGRPQTAEPVVSTRSSFPHEQRVDPRGRRPVCRH
ncbi:unannotated protein [freshwater metagenome]|uniref:Unannotated protein n=1 Tax=freshwater metagenome TaxID=449393 RepID=A0A6J6UNU8_9ZZZZ